MVFFFQAEDGIRGGLVTGVQTCALPISYNQKVASAVPAGQGPDVINLFYGWVPLYVDGGYLQPLPVEAFSPMEIERDFVPMVKNSKFDGKYWALPTAVRSLSLFYNADLLRAADIARPPIT